MPTIRTLFAIDLRALAAFRIGLGLCILADLASRARDVTAHYSDDGVLPRADLITLGHQTFSLYMASGSTWAQICLFILASFAALTLMIGLWTRCSTFVSWLLLASLIARNKLIVQGGDNLLLLLLFWGLFLPLGARYSIDAAVNRAPPPSPHYWSMATTALLLQIAALYFFSALLKSGPQWIPDGTAIAYALHLDFFVTPLGVWLRDFPSITFGLTLYVWYLELLASFLVFFPFWFTQVRWFSVLALVSLHLAIAACLNVGLFPLINLVALVTLIPSSGWQRIEQWLTQRDGRGLTIYYDGDCEFCRKVSLMLQTFLFLGQARILPAQTSPEIGKIMEEQGTWVVEDEQNRRYIRWDALAFLVQHSPFAWVGKVISLPPFAWIGDQVYRWIAANRMGLGKSTALLSPYHESSFGLARTTNLIVGALLTYVLLINIQGLPAVEPQWAERFGNIRSVLGLNQRWDMFAPAPSLMDVWLVARGELVNGTVVDVLNGTEGEPNTNLPLDTWNYYPSYRWRKYISRLVEVKFQPYRPAYANYLCRSWNRTHRDSSPLERLKLYVRTESNELDRRPPQQDTLLILVHSCQTNTTT